MRLDVELRPAAVVEQPLWKGEEDEECRDCQHGQKNEERYPEVLDLLVVRYEKEVYEEYYYQEREDQPEHHILERFK